MKNFEEWLLELKNKKDNTSSESTDSGDVAQSHGFGKYTKKKKKDHCGCGGDCCSKH